MIENEPLCSRFGDSYECPVCKSEHLVKNVKDKNGQTTL